MSPKGAAQWQRGLPVRGAVGGLSCGRAPRGWGSPGETSLCSAGWAARL